MAIDVSFSHPVVIHNIRKDFDSFSLRVFFEKFIEQGGFTIFHFKHRPECSVRKIIKEHFPGVTLPSPALPSAETNPTSSITSDFDFKAYMNKSGPVMKPTNISSPNAFSGFAFVDGKLLDKFIEDYQMKPWISMESSAEAHASDCCHITPLPADAEEVLKKYEEMHPPVGLCNGNVGTKNEHLVKLIRTGILGKGMISKIQKRAPLLWNWAQPFPILCKHSACNFKGCETLFILDIPSSYVKRDLKNFFHKFLIEGHMCDLIYLKRPSSNLKLFIQENLPLSSLDEFVEDADCSTLCYDSDAASNVLDLYPFSRKASGATKSCWVRVARNMCEEFISDYHGRSWNGGDEKCVVYKVKQEHTACLAFLSEFWKFGNMVNLSNSTQEPMEHFKELFSAGLPSATVAGRLQAALPQVWQQIQDATAMNRTNKACLLPKGAKLFPKKQFSKLTAAIPPPPCLLDTQHDILESPTDAENRLPNEQSQDVDGAAAVPCEDVCDSNDQNNIKLSPKVDGDCKEKSHESTRRRNKRNGQKRKRTKNYPTFTPMEASEDGSDVEEWERSEAFRDTIDEKRSAKERLYEEEIELVWEKGGSGLNFHTDASYWREQEGGFDERTTDEWDVDMQGYYGGRPGDYDAECRQDMDRMDRLRAGGDESCFGPPPGRAPKSKRRRTTTSLFIAPCSESPDAARRRMLVNLRTDDEPVPLTKTARRRARKARNNGSSKNIGEFEQHTRGVGRQVLEALGWKDGQGLGRDGSGRPHIVEAVHRKPLDKRGVGFEDTGDPWKAAKTDNKNQSSDSEEGEDEKETMYKNLPIQVLAAHSKQQRKIFEEDFNILFSGCTDPDKNDDHMALVSTMHTSRREKLRKILNSLKDYDVLPPIDQKKFVPGGMHGLSSNNKDCENEINESDVSS